eukprot:scaffold584_cov338-Pavlova_lutheri.AAC.2
MCHSVNLPIHWLSNNKVERSGQFLPIPLDKGVQGGEPDYPVLTKEITIYSCVKQLNKDVGKW